MISRQLSTMGGARFEFRGQHLRDCSLLLLLPLVLVWLNDSWLYNFPGWGDQWIYFGNHLDLPRKVSLYKDSYRAMRLAWNVLGYLLYSRFPPETALYVLHLGMLAIALVSFYVLALRTATRRAAVITTALLGTYPMFLTAVGWDYVDGASITYMLAAAACAAIAATARRHQIWSMLSGAAFAASVYTYPFMALYGPVLLIVLHEVRNRGNAPGMLRAAAWMALGAAALTLVLCIISRLLGGHFLFMLPAISFGKTIVNELEKTDVYGVNSVNWIAQAPWLILPFGVFAASGWIWCRRLFRGSAADESGAARNLLPALVALFLVFAVADFWLHIGVLRIAFFSSLLIPAMFLALAILLAGPLEKLSVRAFALTAAGVAGAGALALAPPVLPYGADLRGAGLWLIALIFIPIGFVPRLRPAGRAALAIAACIGTGLLWVSVANWHPKIFYEGVPPKRDVFAASWKAIRAAQEVWPRGKYRFWYSADDPLTKNEFNGSLAMATTVSTEVIVSDKFPTDQAFIPGYINFYLTPGTQLIILSDRDDPLADAEATFRKHKLKGTRVALRTIEAGTMNFKMHFILVGQAAD